MAETMFVLIWVYRVAAATAACNVHDDIRPRRRGMQVRSVNNRCVAIAVRVNPIKLQTMREPLLPTSASPRADGCNYLTCSL